MELSGNRVSDRIGNQKNLINMDKQLLSKTIDALRLPLIVGVVFIHNSSSGIPGYNLDEVLNEELWWGGVDSIIVLVSGIIASCAVPIFFFFSGYLFFRNVENFEKKVYLAKITSRARSLLIPYLTWVCIGVVIYGLLATLPYTSHFWGNGNFSFSSNYILENITGLKFVDGSHTYQIGYHLWFLRDLFVMCLISPLFYWSLRSKSVWKISALCFLWILGISIPYLNNWGFNSSAIIFFGLGAYFGINKMNFLMDFDKCRILAYVSYPVLVIVDWNIRERVNSLENLPFYYEMIHASMILVALPFWVNLTTWLIKKRYYRNWESFAAASFFIYLVHVPFILPQVKKILYVTVKPNSQVVLLLLYLASVFLACLIAGGIYYLMAKKCPRVLSFLTGGR